MTPRDIAALAEYAAKTPTSGIIGALVLALTGNMRPLSSFLLAASVIDADPRAMTATFTNHVVATLAAEIDRRIPEAP